MCIRDSSDTYRAKNSGVYGKMYQLINQYNETTGQFGLANTAEARNSYLRQAEMRNTDWFDVLFSNNIIQNHSVSITSASYTHLDVYKRQNIIRLRLMRVPY